MSSAPQVELYEPLGEIAAAVTKAYRLGRPYARTIDQAHGRLIRRYGLRGTAPADDPDLMVCGQAVRDLQALERAGARRGLLDALQRLDGRPYIGDLLRARKAAP